MITPVENGSTCCSVQPSIDATAAQVVSAAAIAGAPVPALALPALTTSARMPEPARGGGGRPDRRGAEAVLREHARRDRAGLEHDEQQVVALPVLDLRRRRAERYTRNGQQGRGLGGVYRTGMELNHRDVDQTESVRRDRCLGCRTRACTALRSGRGIACISCRSRRDRDRCARPCRRRARTAGRRAADRPRPRQAPRRNRRAGTGHCSRAAPPRPPERPPASAPAPSGRSSRRPA